MRACVKANVGQHGMSEPQGALCLRFERQVRNALRAPRSILFLQGSMVLHDEIGKRDHR